MPTHCSIDNQQLALDLENIQRALPFPLLMLDAQQRLRRFNPAAHQQLGVDQTHLGQPVDALNHMLAVGDLINRLDDVSRDGNVRDIVLEGHPPGRLMIHPYLDHEGRTQGTLLFLKRDAAEEHLDWFEQRLLERATHFDPLTGLANRLLFNERLDNALDWSQRRGTRLAVLFMDLDNFKRINESLGHGIGDDLLKAVADRLRTVIRQEDTLARLGGDEFVVLLEHDIDIQGARSAALRLGAALESPIVVQGHQLRISISTGIALYPDDGTNADTLMRHADGAMYDAKRVGVGQFAFVDPGLSHRLREQLAMESALCRALETHTHELLLEYQPQIDLRNGQVTSFEALVRWQHPTLGRLPPARFLPLVRTMGLGQQLDRWALDTAIAQHHRWHEQGSPLARYGIAVNIMPEQLQPEQCRQTPLDAFLTAYHTPLDWLTLEITEEGLISESDITLAMLKRLRRLGIGLAIDDFGVGYANFAYIARLPINKVKLDMTLVQGVANERRSEILVEGLNRLLCGLDMSCIAEGVEDAALAAKLAQLGVASAQGFHYSRALSVDALPIWLERYQMPTS
ncbi:putative bifunctional diguanylate cyclase/phosphodiesterase [Aidingimonas lacisalsi]|uniref:putative bifunctional diguanylate cyclase/phosphodiesterase n=1 Tax=Aidingimonas lacisalsi TaxID=2604086 RepID=UPI0011D2124D|nr:EAL domain-containing protein [Aidingimonas lacisalsi]